MGISEEGLKRLFKPYQQADKSIAKNFGGTGLGLCICSELATIMNGKIQVDSKLNQGTEFIVSIPAEVSGDLTTYIDEFDFDREFLDGDLNNFEFVVCNERTFGIQQIKKIFVKSQAENIYLKEPRELLKLDQDPVYESLFQHVFTLIFNILQEKTFKAFIVDY